MAVTKTGSGTSIEVTIPLDKAITEYDNILAALYTNPVAPVRFSYLEKEGYNKLEVGSSPNELVGVLKSEQTAKMKGCLMMVMKAVDETTPSENIGVSVPIFTNIEFFANPLN